MVTVIFFNNFTILDGVVRLFLPPTRSERVVEKKLSEMSQMFSFNVRPARSKTDNFLFTFNTFQPIFDIIMLTETWYSDDGDFFLLLVYEHFYLNGEDNRGGYVSSLITSRCV